MDSPPHRPADPRAPPALPELRLVLLGRKGAGKSAAGNTILGGSGGFESGKPTEECVKRRADVAGRKVIVVDTPGWEWYYPLNGTAQWVRRETLRSVSLCPPGPNAVLLVVRSCASITEDYMHEIEEHLELLGKGVWGHTMLLFTRGDELGLTSMEQRVSTSGPTLQRLLQKCSGRYHVVNNLKRGDVTQVTELIGKLEELAGGGRFLETDHVALAGLEADGKRKARERRKKQRQMEEHMQRATIKAALLNDGLQGSELDAHQSFSKVPRRLPEVRLVLLGERETGKSSAGNSILGRAGFFQAGVVTEECVRRQAEAAMRLVTVVDTPGWEAGITGGTTERVKREIATSVGLCPPGPHALLLTLRVDTLVVSGHVREHLELLTEGAWRHTILLFTHGDQLRKGVNIQQHIQGGGRDLQWLLEKCRGQYHVISSLEGRGNGCSGEVTELLQKVEKMAARNRCEAFSGLVQDIRDFSQQKNEKFNQRMKDVEDKMFRQEAELKKMREREMKSIRWFFERKKKVKSSEKSGVQRDEEDEDSRRGEIRTDYRELEERIRWLTEDKEREIQDLSVERERIYLALSQGMKERDNATFRLDLKNREIEELKERIEEQQLKLLNLECASAERENERKHWEENTEALKREWKSKIQKLEGDIELQKKEKEAWMEEVLSLKRDMEESRMMEQQLRAEMEAKLLEKDQRQEELRQEMQAIVDHAKLHHGRMEMKVAEMASQHQKEAERNAQNKEEELRKLTLQHRQEVDRRNSEMRKIQEEIKAQHQQALDKIEAMKKQHSRENVEIRQEKEREVEELQRRFADETERQAQGKIREMRDLEQRYLVQLEREAAKSKDESERIQAKFRKETTEKIREQEKEVELVRREHREELERRLKETEERRAEEQREMEKAVEELKKEYGDKIRGVEEDSRRELKETRQQLEKEIEKQLEKRQRMEKCLLELEERLAESEKAKEAMVEKHKTSIWRHSNERETREGELKRAHANELRDRMKEFEKEKERIVTRLQEETERTLKEREVELEEQKRGLRVTKEMLQQAEDEKRDLEERQRHERHLREALEKKDKLIETLNQRMRDVNETLQRKEDENNQQKEAEERMQQLLEGKEREIESLKQQAQYREVKWRDELSRKDTEINVAKEAVDQERRETTEARRLLAEREGERREVEKERAGYVEALKEMDLRVQQSQAERMEMLEKVREGEEEIHRLRREDGQKEKELGLLRWRIEQTKSELKDVSRRMEKEMSSMIREYETEIERKNRMVESVEGERDHVLKECEDGRRRMQDLQEEHEKMRGEAEHLRLKLKEAEEELSRWNQEQVESPEADLREEDAQIKRLKEAEDTLRAELDVMKEEKAEADRKLQETKDELQVKLSEKERDFTAKSQQIREEISKREKEVAEREKVLARFEEALSKRGSDLDRKEEELIENEARQFGETQGRLERRRDGGGRQGDKREELKKMPELPGFGSENGEEPRGERGSSSAEEQPMQQDHVAPATQQLDGTEELRKKEKSLEKNPKEREEELDSADEDDLARRELRGQGEGSEPGREGDAKDKEELRRRRAPPAMRRNNHHPAAEINGGKEGTVAERKATIHPSQAKVTRDSQFLSAGRGHCSSDNTTRSHGSDLRVVVLGESWSSYAPDGVTILCGERSKQEGSTCRHWRGQVAGHRLFVVEPLGLKWRDGPGLNSATQKKSLLDSVAQCRPHVVLLLLPAFLTCTGRLRSAVEEHVGWLGADAWRRALVLVTWGEVLGESVEQHVQRNGDLMGLVGKCQGRCHMVTSYNNNSLVGGLLEKMEEMVALERC